MKRHFLGKILALLLFLSSVSVVAGELTPQEKQWLGKAYRAEKNGWIFLHIEGKPFQMGFQRGYLTANEIEDFYLTLAHTTEFTTGKSIDYFVDAAARLLSDKVPEEYRQEMLGMVEGARKAGKQITYEQMLLMNGFIDIVEYWWPVQSKQERVGEPGCSAFIATGDATADGQIVMGHNSWFYYDILRFCNVVLEIVPEKGHRILMQTWGPSLYSSTDFFITDAGLLGTETTIGGFEGYNEEGVPVFVRARKAMQYANNIDEWARIMIDQNNGAYANSWLLGDVNTNEIARLELGLKYHKLEKKKNGYFTGSNVAEDVKILREETDATYDDIRDFSVARRVRWKQLMEQYYGKIDVEIGKKMLADHYDVYLEKETPSFRTICGHWEVDNGMVPGTGGAYLPGGAIDGKVVDAKMVKEWKIWVRWGHPCGTPFDAGEFLRRHPQYEWRQPYLKDIPANPWTIMQVK